MTWASPGFLGRCSFFLIQISSYSKISTIPVPVLAGFEPIEIKLVCWPTFIQLVGKVPVQQACKYCTGTVPWYHGSIFTEQFCLFKSGNFIFTKKKAWPVFLDYGDKKEKNDSGV